MRHIAFIGIGSNIGNKIAQCEAAICEILRADRHTLLAKSSFYKTQPLGYTRQDWFVNGVIKIETDLEPVALLRSLSAIESRMGPPKAFRWGPRTIDLDILFFDGGIVRTAELQIPHPLLHERRFVLVPLAEIDPSLLHPVLGKTIQELLENLKEDQGVEKV